MVKIQSSLPKSLPPDAWPSCSLIEQILEILWLLLHFPLVPVSDAAGFTEHFFPTPKDKKLFAMFELTSQTHQNWTRWFWTALPSISCTCPPAQLSRRSSLHGEQSVYASTALSRLASVGEWSMQHRQVKGRSRRSQVSVCRHETPLTKLGSLFRQASTNSLSGLL